VLSGEAGAGMLDQGAVPFGAGVAADVSVQGSVTVIHPLVQFIGMTCTEPWAGGGAVPFDGGAWGAENWPRTAPGMARVECTSAKKAVGFSSMRLTLKPQPWSCIVAGFVTPVTNPSAVPCKHPTERREFSPSATGFGNAMRGGPDLPAAPSWMWVAVLAGDW